MSGDTAELVELAAKRTDALKAAKMAGLAGDDGPALELAGIEDGERIAADAEADAAAMIDAAKTGRELADVLAALAPPDVLAALPFGAKLPRPVLWRDAGDAAATPERAGTVLCAGEVAMLSGPGEAGKSTVAVALADAARDGGMACGLHVARGKVAALSYEDSGPREHPGGCGPERGPCPRPVGSRGGRRGARLRARAGTRHPRGSGGAREGVHTRPDGPGNGTGVTGGPGDRGPIPMGNGGSDDMTKRAKRTMADAMQAAAEAKSAAKTIPSRRGKRAWVVYLDPNTSRRLKAAAAMSDRSMQSLGVEAADWLIERYGTR